MRISNRYLLLAIVVASSFALDVALTIGVLRETSSDLRTGLLLAAVFSQSTSIGAWAAIGTEHFANRVSIGICFIAAISALTRQAHHSNRDPFAMASLLLVVVVIVAFLLFLGGRPLKLRRTSMESVDMSIVAKRRLGQFSLVGLFQCIAATGLLIEVLKNSDLPMLAAMQSRESMLLTILEALFFSAGAAFCAVPVIGFAVFAAWAIWSLRFVRVIGWIVAMIALMEAFFLQVAPGNRVVLPLAIYSLLVVGYLATFQRCGYPAD